jgi:hypothetical protein
VWEKLKGNFITEGKEGRGNILTSGNKIFMAYVYILKDIFKIEGEKNSEKYYGYYFK